ncbi:MAG: hypothetical protein GF388_10345 [Candidatus Aegiribacteria sp.]|nr:hypothetical protein [Candidatus Aegiribacteria sp.]MBD3295424.1 hypothetical protein [Candidatus Fermentibacteria bacterium]
MKIFANCFRNRQCILYAAVIIAGILLRLFRIEVKSLWVDEAYVAGLMDQGPLELIRMSVAGSPHPPLAFLFFRFSTALLGQGELGLRIIPALASALAAVPLMNFVKRRTGIVPAFWAGMVWALAPFSVSMGQEAWLYGIVAFLGYLLTDTADRAWREGGAALYVTVALALAGMLVQHLFAFFAAAVFFLYFTVPRSDRIPFKTFITASAVFLLLYSPFALLLLKQAGFRSERIARAGMDMAAVYRIRFLMRMPTVFIRLIPGGVLLDLARAFAEGGKQIAFWLVFGLVNILLMANLFISRIFRKPFKIWLILVFVVPFLFFLKEDPTVRHMTILWVPFGFAIAAAAVKWKFAGPLLCLLVAVMLLPYYNIVSYPYHRSDWRGAVKLVEDSISSGQGILVIGGNAGGPAWDYYASEDLPRTILGGEDPYSEKVLPGRGLESVLDSLLEEHESLWLVHDFWNVERTSCITDYCEILWRTWISPHMEVIHLSRRN